jgi:hypothetical protein
LGLAYDRGFTEVLPAFRAHQEHLVAQILDSAYNPWNVGNYYMPAYNNSTALFQNWADVKSALATCFQNATSMAHRLCAGGTGTSDLELNYEHVALAAGSYLQATSPSVTDSDGMTTLTGANAYTWLSTNITGQANMYKMPKWAILPRNMSARNRRPPKGPAEQLGKAIKK